MKCIYLGETKTNRKTLYFNDAKRLKPVICVTTSLASGAHIARSKNVSPTNLQGLCAHVNLVCLHVTTLSAASVARLCADQRDASTPPPPPPWHLAIFCARGVGNLNFSPWGGRNWTGRARFQFFFSGAEVRLTAIKHVFERVRIVWRKRYSICERFACKKGLQQLGTDRQIRRQGRAFEHYFSSRGGEFERSNFQKFKWPWLR